MSKSEIPLDLVGEPLSYFLSGMDVKTCKNIVVQSLQFPKTTSLLGDIPFAEYIRMEHGKIPWNDTISTIEKVKDNIPVAFFGDLLHVLEILILLEDEFALHRFDTIQVHRGGINIFRLVHPRFNKLARRSQETAASHYVMYDRAHSEGIDKPPDFGQSVVIDLNELRRSAWLASLRSQGLLQTLSKVVVCGFACVAVWYVFKETARNDAASK